MKCLRKYKWLKLHRACLPAGRGIMGYWATMIFKQRTRNWQKNGITVKMES